MITYLPMSYPDETIYSLLSRAYEKGGYLSISQAKEEFFEQPKEKFDFLFTNKLVSELANLFTKTCSWENFLEEHTLLNYYGRYLTKDKREKAYKALLSMEGNYNNLFSLTPNRREEEEFLRYCPLCAEEQRNIYGETYWNRIFQISEITVCPKHGCKLLNSGISKNRHKTTVFAAADTEIKDFSVYDGTNKEILLAKYIEKMVHTQLSLDNNVEISKYFVAKMENTPYLSNRGQIINLHLLYEDMTKFYTGFSVGIKKEWQISKILHGERRNPFEIAQTAFFLGISPEELINATMPEKAPEDNFDEKVLTMLKNGMSAYKIAEELNVSKSLIRLVAKNNGVRLSAQCKYVTSVTKNGQNKIEECRKVWLEAIEKYPNSSYSYICEHSEHKLQLRWLRRNDKEWTDQHFPKKAASQKKSQRIYQMDAHYLPLIESYIQEYKEKDGEMPKRITLSAMSKFIGIKNRDIYSMKRCRDVIGKYEESQEEFWARKIIWAISVLEKESKTLNWNNIKRLVHIQRENYYSCRELLLRDVDAAIIETCDPVEKAKI